MTKHDIEEYLARIADGGVLVECGVATGDGLVAMRAGTSRGRNLPIYGIDPYLPFRDGLDHEYDASSKPHMQAAINQFATYVHLLEQSAETAALDWQLPIAVLWLDLSMSFERLKAIIDAFEPYIIPGGYVGVTGLEYGQLGTRRILETLSDNGTWQPAMTDQDKVAVLRKRTPNRAVFYIASGDDGRYVAEARRSAESVKEFLGVDTILFTNEAAPSGFTHYEGIPRSMAKFWYLRNTEIFNYAVQLLTDDYQQLLYLDVDTRVCLDCSDIWQLLQQFDLAVGHSASRDCIQSAIGCPQSFPTYQIGVNLFSINDRTRKFFADWLTLYNNYADVYDENDEAPYRDALWENTAGIKWMCMAPEYCLRFDFGAWVNGKVRILHGRIGGRSQPDPKEVADEINSHTRMRLWDHGLVVPK